MTAERANEVTTSTDGAAFSVRIRTAGGAELEVSGPDRAWVDAKLAELQDRTLGKLKQDPPPAIGPDGAGDKAPSVAEHVRRVAPSGGVEHVLAAGYYLEHHTRLLGGFRRRDLAEAFRAVRYEHSNPGVPIAEARRRGLIMDGAEHEKMQLTESAERWVSQRLAGAVVPLQ